MNLVDAIRRASAQAVEPVATVQASVDADPEVLETMANQEEETFTAADEPRTFTNTLEPTAEPASVPERVTLPATIKTKPTPIDPVDDGFPSGPGLNLVRFEIFLTPEQMSALLRGALTSHRSVMTVRDAAAYLRVPSAQVEKLAHEGKLPGFLIEGTWRFLKATIDEWVTTRTSATAEELKDVA